MLPADPFGRSRAPRSATREGRVALLVEASRLLMAEGSEAGLFTGGALQAWMRDGGDLARDHFAVVKASSRHTVQYLARSVELSDGAVQTVDDDGHAHEGTNHER